MSIRERLLATVSQYIAAYNEFDPSATKTVRTPTCLTHGIAPTCKFIQSMEEHTRHMMLSRGVFRSVNVSIVDNSTTVVDEVSRRVVVKVKIRCETTVGPYENEAMFIMAMNEEETLVDEIFQFLDTARFRQFQGRLEEAQGSRN
ncbi:hypothetical protein BDV09DRAFT_194298 [Aspergillus tetrazonus]